jgi:hypothetical protein
MYLKYHRLITQQALQNNFGSTALQTIVKANMFKDDLISNLFNPEHHFIENTIEGSLAYIETQRHLVVCKLENGDNILAAWQAFGRLLHTGQDFYAHSNYVRLWVDRFAETVPPADKIEALDPSLLNSPHLHTVRTYRPLGSLGNIPVVGRWLFRFLPVDAHARMCLDSPANGPLFEYAFNAAVKRTAYEYEETERAIKRGGVGEYLNLFLNQSN